jgi:hypothetical protein
MLAERAAALSAPDRIMELEHELDAHLRDRAKGPRGFTVVREAAHEWSKAVWSEGLAQGPAVLAPAEIERGLSLAQRPVFICGVARSGTTLLRDLLDSHSRLAVLPTESLFYTDMETRMFGLPPERHCAFLGCEWLERLVYPPPHWLLGAPRRGNSPYVRFARDFAAWCQVPAEPSGAMAPSWPLAAFALAYAQRLGDGRIPPGAEMWVEKTLTNELFLERIWRDFPAAKVIHIVRRPEAVLASLKAIQGRTWSYRSATKMCLGFMARSYRIAANSGAQLPDDRYHLVRYEDLAASPAQVMSDIAAFLGIEPHPTMERLSVAGLPAINNTSFGEVRPDLAQALDAVERALLAVSVARSAAKLGYGPRDSLRWTPDPVVGAPAPEPRSRAASQ